MTVSPETLRELHALAHETAAAMREAAVKVRAALDAHPPSRTRGEARRRDLLPGGE